MPGKGWPKSTRPQEIEAQFDSRCPECFNDIQEGDTIYWSEYHDAYVCSKTCR